MVVDQSSTIGALPVAVAQGESIVVGYSPGLAMLRIADLHPGEDKLPGTLRIIAKAGRHYLELDPRAADPDPPNPGLRHRQTSGSPCMA